MNKDDAKLVIGLLDQAKQKLASKFKDNDFLPDPVTISVPYPNNDRIIFMMKLKEKVFEVRP